MNSVTQQIEKVLFSRYPYWLLSDSLLANVWDYVYSELVLQEFANAVQEYLLEEVEESQWVYIR